MRGVAERTTVSVIVPTTALAVRETLIWRAINSILDQSGVHAIPIVIVNGPGRDLRITRELMADRRLRVRVVETGSLAGALQAGRWLVDEPWFAELDDDDVLMPGALLDRINALKRSTDYDCVVTNGLRRANGEDTLNISDMKAVERDPIRAFFDANWLLPGSYLCRTDRIRPELFDGMPESLECTFIALRLAASYRIKFLDHATVIWHVDTPGSLSKSRGWLLAQAHAHERILTLDLPSHARREVWKRITHDCHSAAHLHLHEGSVFEAWRWHLRSLYRPGGHQYLRYTLRLLWAALAQARTAR